MLRTINVQADIHSQLRLEAFGQNRSLQSLVNEILSQHFRSSNTPKD